MPYSEIRQVIKDSVRSRYFGYLWGLRALTTIFPLIGTFLFSRVVAALENKDPVTNILFILFIALLLQVLDNLLRLYSKTRIEFVSGKISLTLQHKLITRLPAKLQADKKIIQACINLSLSIERLILYINESGINGLVFFVFIPLILFFVDIRIFLLS